VDRVRLAGHDLEPAARQQHRDLLRPLAADERVLIAVDHDCRLLDQRQALLDPVGQHRPRGRQQHPRPRREIVARRQRDQGERLAGRVA